MEKLVILLNSLSYKSRDIQLNMFFHRLACNKCICPDLKIAVPICSIILEKLMPSLTFHEISLQCFIFVFVWNL